MIKKILSIAVSGLWLVAGVAGAHEGEVHQAAQVLEAQSSVGGKAEFDAVQSGAVRLNTKVRVDSHAEAEKAESVSEAKDGPRFRFSWDSQADLGVDEQRAAEVALKLRAEAAAKADTNIQGVEITPEEVTIDYRRPAKLFGFIPVAYSHAFTLDGKGQISHGRPWWLIFASDDAVDFELGVEAAFQHNQSNLDFLKLQNIIDRQDKILQTLSNILKTRHDVAMSAIRNMK